MEVLKNKTKGARYHMRKAENYAWWRIAMVAFVVGLVCANAAAQETEKRSKTGKEAKQKPPAKLSEDRLRPVDAQSPEQRPPVVQSLPESAKTVCPTMVAVESATETETAAVGIERWETIPPPRFGLVGFVLDRALDLCDLFRFRLHVPNGFRSIGFKARGTCLAQAGFVYFDGKSAGIDRRGLGIWRERRLEGGIGPIYFSRVFDEMIAGNRYTDVRRPWSRLYQRGIVRSSVFWDDGRLHPLSCGGEVQLFVFGLEFEVYPLEWLDAAIGWVGLDPFNDDDSRIVRRWYQWQTIPELKVRDEWQETYRPAKKVAPPSEEKVAPRRRARAPMTEKPITKEEKLETPKESTIESPEESRDFPARR